MPKKLLVVMPTTGTPLDLRRIRGVVSNTARAARGFGLKPVFMIATSPGPAKAVELALKGTGQEFRLLTDRPAGFGAAILQGVREGMRAEKPSFVMTMFADYRMEAKHLKEIISAITGGRHDFVASAWRHGKSTALEFPLPQYLNETRVSAAVTYANPNFVPEDANPYAAVAQAQKEGAGLQVFSGTFGFPASAWPSLRKGLQAFKGAQAHVDSWGLEPALMLSALKSGLRVSNAFFSRGYEHPFPQEKDRDRFLRSRLEQYDSGMAVVKHFLSATGQREKLARLGPVISQERKRMENSPLSRQHQAPLKEKFGAKFLYRKE